MANWYCGSTKYTAVTQWAALTTLAVGAIKRQLASPTLGNERCFRVSAITTGITGASEPAWNLGQNATTTDAGVTWTECTGQAIYNGDGGGTAWAAPAARLNMFLSNAWASPGDNVYVSNNHAETQSSAIAYNNSVLTGNSLAQCLNVLCVNDAAAPPTALATTATVTTTGASALAVGPWSNSSISGLSYFYGITFNCGTGASAANLVTGRYNGFAYFDTCAFNLVTTSNSSQLLTADYSFNTLTQSFYKNCSFSFGAAGQTVDIGSGCSFVGGSFAATGTVPTAPFVGSHNNPTAPLFRDMDLSAITGTLVNISGISAGQVLFENCKLGAAVTPVTGTYFGPYVQSVKLHNSDSANTNYRYYYGSVSGTIQQETTVVRTGGATNGVTPISWNLTTTANVSLNMPLQSEEISVWNTNASGAQTATIYLTSNTALTNALLWAEAEYLGTSGFPQGVLVSSKVILLASSAALTSDSSTWGGSITNKYKIVLTFTPTGVGVLKIRLFCASPSTTVYVDPLPVISNQTSGRQYMIPGGTFQNDASSGGGATGGLLINPGMGGGMRG